MTVLFIRIAYILSNSSCKLLKEELKILSTNIYIYIKKKGTEEEYIVLVGLLFIPLGRVLGHLGMDFFLGPGNPVLWSIHLRSLTDLLLHF